MPPWYCISPRSSLQKHFEKLEKLNNFESFFDNVGRNINKQLYLILKVVMFSVQV